MPTIKLSEHFTLQEMTYSQTAAREGLNNTPDLKALSNLKLLAGVMEEVRRICGDNPVTVTSGYRSPEVNAATGGSDTSAHMSGLACDFIIPGFDDPLEICRAIEPYMETLKIDQLIHEYNDWVHLGLTEGEPRNQALTINNSGTSEGFS